MNIQRATCHAKAFRDRGSPVRRVPGFTMIELILVMTILTIAVSVTAPRLANFFRGRALDSEARRLLALTRHGQSRAVSEGIPMELWVDAQNKRFGLEAEPSYETIDDKAEEFTLDSNMELEAVNVSGNAPSSSSRTSMSRTGQTLTRTVLSRHPELPRIRFLPDGTIAENSPQRLSLTGSDGISISLVQSRNGLSYEIGTANN